MVGSLFRSGWAVALILLLGCSGQRQPDERAREIPAKDSHPPDRQATLLFIGTSITAGQGLPTDQRWTALIRSRIDSLGWPFTVVNAGVSGETSAATLGRIDWLLGQYHPKLVLVETGANDGLRGLDIDSLAVNLDSILSRLDRIDPRPVIIVAGMEALPNLGERYVDRFRRVYPTAAARYHDRYLPFLLDSVAGIARLNQADGIHPNALGSEVVARNVWRLLEPVLDSLRGYGSRDSVAAER